MKFKLIERRSWLSIVVWAAANIWVSSALAGDVTVRIHDQVSGKLLSGVSVCVGSGANPSQFGAVVTDSAGQAHFDDIPRTALLLTASAKAYNSLQREFLGQTSKSIQIIRLQPGNRSGPRCDAHDRRDTRRSALRITHFSLAGGSGKTSDRSVVLGVRFLGDASEYRASESANFEGANWREFQPGVTFKLSAASGRKEIFFQVRRILSAAGASLQVTSNVVSDTIYLAK